MALIQTQRPTKQSYRAARSIHVLEMDPAIQQLDIQLPVFLPVENDLKKVGIIGAGISGLYAAMILQSLGIPFEILEASDRCGGRCYTYKFSPSKLDCFDVGAARLPDIPLNRIAFDLFRKLGVSSKLVPYITKSNVRLFNDILQNHECVDVKDPFHVGLDNDGKVPPEYLKEGVQALLDRVFSPFKEEFEKCFNKGWEKLEPFDSLSLRAYMQTQLGYPDSVVSWIETMSSVTNRFDDSFTESVMDFLDFGYFQPAAALQYWCFEGGIDVCITAMRDSLIRPIEYKKRVVQINARPNESSVRLSVDGENDEREYSHIISTMPLSCLSSVDLSSAYLTFQQKRAIRSVRYDAATKVGIKFRTRWWQNLPSPIFGGSSNTDRPSRNIVYPSEGFDDPEAGSVLIASYCKGQDALRMGGFSSSQLISVVLRDLSAVHNVPFSFLNDQMLDYYVHDWYNDEFSLRAFGLWGPSQFTNLFAEITRPAAKGRLHIAGEATSPHRGWITGALTSAWRGVAEILIQEGRGTAELESKWAKPDEIDIDLLTRQVWLGVLGSRRT